MQNIWKKVGAILGSAVMIGATLVGAALAQDTMDLGDYEDLVIDSDGNVQALYVIGASAATADVVGAMGMTAWAGQNAVTTEGAGAGEVTLTPIETTVSGVERHLMFDNVAAKAYEFGGQSPATDLIGPAGWGSGTGVVNYLYSYNEKGPVYFGGTEYKWHEQVTVTLGNINATRDELDTAAGDKYDEVFLTVDANTIEYKYDMDTDMLYTSFQGKKIWFMGKEYTVISASESITKLGASDSEVLLTTTDPTTTISGVDVKLDGIYSTGTGSTYKAKITLTSGGTTETKYVSAASTESIAGIEVYVKDAVVTTTGTNEGEAQMIVGAGILKLEDGSYLKLGDGTETTWQTQTVSGSPTTKLNYITVTETSPYTTVSTTNTVLYAGDSITSPNGLFGLTFNGITDKYGNAPTYVNVDIMPSLKDLNGGNQKTIRVRTPDADGISYYDETGASQKTTKELWVNTSMGDNQWYYRDPTNTSRYTNTTIPAIQLTTANTMSMEYTNVSTVAGTITGYFNIKEPTFTRTDGASVARNMTLEYNASASSIGKFEDVNDAPTASASYYVYYANYANASVVTAANFIADEYTSATTATRDFYTNWGCYVDSVGSTLVSLQCPQEQSMGEFVIGTQEVGTGTAQTVQAGETVTIGGTKLNVTGAIGSVTPAGLPTTVSKLDTEVTSADKSAYTLVLVGGPLINTLVSELQVAGSLEKTIGAPGGAEDVATAGQGVVELVADAFVDGKYAIVVAGSDRAGTKAAANILAHFDDYADTLDDKTAYVVG